MKQRSLPTPLRIGTYLILAFLVSGIIGCSSSSEVNYDSEYIEDHDFSSYKTYKWLIPPSDAIISLRGYPDLIENIITSVDEELAKRGYTLTKTDPDFLVTYHAAIEEAISSNTVNTWGYGYGAGYGRGVNPTDTAFYTYREGSLILDVVDGASDQGVWRGHASGAVEDPLKVGENIKEVVARMLKDFPPK